MQGKKMEPQKLLQGMMGRLCSLTLKSQEGIKRRFVDIWPGFNINESLMK